MSKEQKLVVVLCKDNSLHGKKINMPMIGEVSIEEDGTLEVPVELASLLVNEDSPWDYKDAKAKNKTIVNDALEDEEDVEDEEDINIEGDEEDVDLKVIKENLEKMTLKELVDMAEKAEHDVKEYKSFKTNKKLMVAFLVKKATEEN
jgi:hypothetical protein